TSWIFFFRAEDGIRDKLVTGVQTCALPILMLLNAMSSISQPGPEPPSSLPIAKRIRIVCPAYAVPRLTVTVSSAGNAALWRTYRSEERRVGKEAGARGSTRPSRE